MARASSVAITQTLGGGQSTDAPRSAALRRVMLGIDVAATTAILVLAGLFVRSAWNGVHDSGGFDARHSVFVDIRQRVGGTAQQDAHAAKFDNLLDQFRQLPGASAASLGFAPIGPDRQLDLSSNTFHLSDDEGRSVPVGWLTVGPEYFDALGLTVRQGRSLTAADSGGSIIVITKSLAEALWPNSDAVGQIAHFGTNRTATVVGIVSDAAYGSIASGTTAIVFDVQPSYAYSWSSQFPVVVRADKPERVAPEIERVASETFPDALRIDVVTGEDLVSRDLGRQRLAAWFFSSFGSVTILLGVCGVFGLVAYAAESRRRDLGIRLALGATPQGLVGTAVGGGLTPVVCGAAAGLLLASLLVRLGASLLVGVPQVDPATYAVVFTGLVGASGVAALIGAWRIQRVSPIEALRAE
jgi:hypothetical protein